MSTLPDDVRRRSEELAALEAERVAIHEQCAATIAAAHTARERALATLQERMTAWLTANAGQWVVSPEVLDGTVPYVPPGEVRT